MSCSGSQTCGMENPKTFDGIDGTPIKYGSPGNYRRIEIQAETAFHTRMKNWVGTLRLFSRTYGPPAFNELQWLGHAGAYVCKDGCHGQGRAFDLNYVKWNSYALNIFGGAHASAARGVRRRYLAVDASCRRWFKYTLNGWYPNHHNHIHFDNHTAPVLSKTSTSDVRFVQAVCNNFNFAGLTIDGNWGPATQRAWQKINNKFAYEPTTYRPFSSVSGYAVWLNLVMKHGFKNVPAGYYKTYY